MSIATRSVLIVAALVIVILGALHLFGGPLMADLAQAIHGR